MKKFDIKDLRCQHRHTIEEHPGCYAKGLVKWPDEKTYEKFSGKPWYTYPGYKIGYFDIETDNLNADWGTVLSWAIKEKGGETFVDYITRDELFNGVYDKRIVQSFVDKLREFSIVVGYYSTPFDLALMRAKALHYDIEFPGYGELYTWDLYYTVKSKLKLSRRSLDNTCQYLNIEGKTPIDKNTWRKAKYGDAESIQEVVRHNIGDVEITEKLHDKLEFSRKWLKSSI